MDSLRCESLPSRKCDPMRSESGFLSKWQRRKRCIQKDAVRESAARSAELKSNLAFLQNPDCSFKARSPWDTLGSKVDELTQQCASLFQLIYSGFYVQGDVDSRQPQYGFHGAWEVMERELNQQKATPTTFHTHAQPLVPWDEIQYDRNTLLKHKKVAASPTNVNRQDGAGGASGNLTTMSAEDCRDNRFERAAVTIQRILRGYFVRKSSLSFELDEKSDEESEPPEICQACGKPFSLSQLEDCYEDRCDKCGTWSHSDCLLTHIDLHGEWSLCVACSSDTKSIKGDFRSLPSSFWGVLYKKCGSSSTPIKGDFRTLPSSYWGVLYQEFGSNSTDDPTEDVIASGKEGDMQPLNQCLEYILNFLEGGHAKSHLVPQNVREFVLSQVHDAMRWKRGPRSQKEVSAEVDELNGIMIGIVRNL